MFGLLSYPYSLSQGVCFGFSVGDNEPTFEYGNKLGIDGKPMIDDYGYMIVNDNLNEIADAFVGFVGK